MRLSSRLATDRQTTDRADPHAAPRPSAPQPHHRPASTTPSPRSPATARSPANESSPPAAPPSPGPPLSDCVGDASVLGISVRSAGQWSAASCSRAACTVRSRSSAATRRISGIATSRPNLPQLDDRADDLVENLCGIVVGHANRRDDVIGGDQTLVLSCPRPGGTRESRAFTRAPRRRASG